MSKQNGKTGDQDNGKPNRVPDKSEPKTARAEESKANDLTLAAWQKTYANRKLRQAA